MMPVSCAMARQGALAPCALLFVACTGVSETEEILEKPSASDAGVTRDAGSTPRDAGVSAPDGAPCIRSDDCAGGYCIRRGEFPGGYCTAQACVDDTDCDRPSGACLDFDNLRYCAAPCGGGCRVGYVCEPSASGLEVCVPDVVATEGYDGDPCSGDAQCRGGVCLRAPDWPGGYCTTARCEAQSCSDNPERPATCAPPFFDTPGFDIDAMCTVVCDSYDDCREGYGCLRVASSFGLCLPDNAEAPALASPDSYPFPFTCGLRPSGGELAFEFELPPGTQSYAITVLSRDGRFVTPMDIRGPTDLLLSTRHELYARTSGLLRNTVPILVPMTPSDASLVEPGTYTYRLQSRSEELCYYLFTESTPGVTLDLNIHFTSIPVASAASAPNDPNIAEFVASIREVFATAGITVGEVRFFDVPQPAANQLRIIRDLDEIVELGGHSRDPGPRLSDRLSMNVFLIESFRIPDGSPLGVSPGIPGVLGLHAIDGAGIVMEASLLGQIFDVPGMGPVNGNEFLGPVVAHEVGHFMGLFHTTETSGDTDPIPDTPECPLARFPEDCPDLDNVMFPLAFPRAQSFSGGQAYVLGANPLTKE